MPTSGFGSGQLGASAFGRQPQQSFGGGLGAQQPFAFMPPQTSQGFQTTPMSGFGSGNIQSPQYSLGAQKPFTQQYAGVGEPQGTGTPINLANNNLMDYIFRYGLQN